MDSFPAKENADMENALLDWPIVLPYDVKARYRLISFKSYARLYPFDKPIKSFYFRPFAVSLFFLLVEKWREIGRGFQKRAPCSCVEQSQVHRDNSMSQLNLQTNTT